MKKTFSVISLGCPKNYVDSEYICEKMTGNGFRMTSDADDADIVVVNTCAFLEASVEESVSTMLEWIDRGKEVVCTGCIVSRYREELRKELPEIRIFAGPGTYDGLPGMIEKGQAICSMPVYGSVVSRSLATTPGYAYVKISEGCSNHCNYCLIPSLRGELKSKPVNDVLEECRSLANAGSREIILIGQDLGSYGKDSGIRDGLPVLVEKICRIENVEWLRLMYMHPASLTKKLVKVMMDNPKVCRYMDIPIQHVSEKVLKAMGRKGGKRAVDDAIRLLDDAGIWIRTTLMVGHHGEGEKEFSELEEFVNSGIIGSMGAFAYSPEVGTKSSLAPQMNWKEKEGRLKRIMKLQKQVSKKRLKAYAGRKEKVLIEGLHPETDMLLRARTSFQAPDVDGITIINEGLSGFGKMASARITGSTDYDLIGRIE